MRTDLVSSQVFEFDFGTGSVLSGQIEAEKIVLHPVRSDTVVTYLTTILQTAEKGHHYYNNPLKPLSSEAYSSKKNHEADDMVVDTSAVITTTPDLQTITVITAVKTVENQMTIKTELFESEIELESLGLSIPFVSLADLQRVSAMSQSGSIKDCIGESQHWCSLKSAANSVTYYSRSQLSSIWSGTRTAMKSLTGSILSVFVENSDVKILQWCGISTSSISNKGKIEITGKHPEVEILSSKDNFGHDIHKISRKNSDSPMFGKEISALLRAILTFAIPLIIGIFTGSIVVLVAVVCTEFMAFVISRRTSYDDAGTDSPLIIEFIKDSNDTNFMQQDNNEKMQLSQLLVS